MRYLIFIISSIIGGIATAGILPNAEIFGLQPDILLVLTLCCVLLEETPMPIVFTSIVTVFMDLFYTGSIGTYTAPYAIVCLLTMWIMHGRKKDRIVVPVAVCAVAWLIKDLLTAFTVFLGGNLFEFGKLFLENTLPETLFNCILMLFVYQLYFKIFERRSIKINRLNSYVEKPKFEGAAGSIYKRSDK